MSTTPTYDPATQPKRPEASLGELLSDMTSDLSTLFRKEIELAKTEAKDEAGRAGKAAGMLGAGAVAAWLALVMLSFALAWLLDQALNLALSFAIVGILWVIAAAVLVTTGRRKITTLKTLPQTTETIKEDVAWAKAQKS
jgi:predicted metal-binding membrane protein